MSNALRLGWLAVAGVGLATRLGPALWMPLLGGYDAIGHVSYVFFLDVYRSLPFADQGWLYFHPPLHYALGWLLAQTGSPEALVRGLAVWNGLASLGVAALSSRVVTLGLPGRPVLALLAFVAVAFLPVHLYASPMPGNELTVALLGVAALTCHLANQRRAQPDLGRDAVTGALAGAALLTKYNGLLPLLAIAAALLLRAVRPGIARGQRPRLVLRLAVIAGVALIVCGGYYARNAVEFGTPLPMQGHRPVLDDYESRQPPGERSWRDLVALSPRLLIDPAPLAPHMLHSIWGTFYASLWVHLDRPGSNLPTAATRALLLLGLAPTALAFAGLLLSLQRCWRRPDACVDASLVLLTLGGLLAFVIFAFGTPTFAALKPMYLLGLSPAYGFFLALAVARLAAHPRWRLAAVAAIAGAGVASAGVYTALALRPAPESVQMAFVRSHFGERDAAARIYAGALAEALRGAEAGGGRLNPLWARGMLAAAKLESGHAAEARALYAENLASRPAEAGRDPGSDLTALYSANRLAVATALDGEPAGALALLDGALAGVRPTELLVNRGALHALAGDLDAAERDLREALADIPRLPPALANLAWVLDRRGAPGGEALRAAAERSRLEAPRYYPYGVGDGRGLNTQRYMLELRQDGLVLYRPGRAR